MQWPFLLWKYIYYFFGSGLESVGHSFACVAHFEFLRDVSIRTPRAATNLATHLSDFEDTKIYFLAGQYL